MQGLAQLSNQRNWLLPGCPEDVAPHAELCARVVAACEVLACLRTQPVPAQPWSPALRAPTKSVASELLACKGAGEDVFRRIHEEFLPTLKLCFGCRQSKDGGRRGLSLH